MAESSVKKSLLVLLGVSLFCSFLVSSVVVKLHAMQQENRRLDKLKNILVAADLYQEGASLTDIYERRIEPRLIELQSGVTVPEDQIHEALRIEKFDIKTLAHDPVHGEAIPPEQDTANIRRRPKFVTVYLVKTGERATKVILPIYGKGLWSTLYGFLTLDQDLKTISAITFYEHGETPGLGGEVDNVRWKNSWNGKRAFDEKGGVAIEVLKGAVNPESDRAKHQIDGLAGATFTSRGVNNLIRYWLGENGYGPFLSRLGASVEFSGLRNDV